MKKIFLVDDQPESCSKITNALLDRYKFKIFTNPEEVLNMEDFTECDGLLVDVNMPSIRGDVLIKELRKKVQRPIPFCLVTGENIQHNMTHYYSFIIDEFFNKLSDEYEIQSRFDTVLRRVKTRSQLLEHGPVKVDLTRAMILINDKELHCTTTEYRILCQLVIELLDKDYVNREHFITSLWGRVHVEDKTISTHLVNLNKKLDPFGLRVKTKRFKGLYIKVN